MVWPIYNWWSAQPCSIELIEDVITPGRRPLREWLSSSIFRVPYLERSAKEWLRIWGFDLKLMHRDRGARNAASYGPSGIHDWQVMSERRAIEILALMWRTFEPADSSRFEHLDRWFLREVLLVVFSSQTKRKFRSANWDRDFEGFIDQFFSGQPADHTTERERKYWQDFLNRSVNETKPELFDLAAKESTLSHESFPVELLSRAAFHLRLATGSCALLLNKAKIDWGELAFWLDRVRDETWVLG